jgi:hypothetical protein
MWAATGWDDEHTRAWTVMGRLQQRQALLRSEARAARRRLEEEASTLRLMTAASARRDYENAAKARWNGGPTVLAFLFAPPDCEAIGMLDARGEYFDQRTGDAWDLFFPGYYRSEQGADREQRTGAVPVGGAYAANWYFNFRDFDALRAHVELESGGSWAFSGGADLVLVNGWMPESGEIEIDWKSTLSGQLTDGDAGVTTLTLGAVIERISRDLEQALEDPSYGVGAVVTDAGTPPDTTALRELVVNTLAGIAAALAAREMGA